MRYECHVRVDVILLSTPLHLLPSWACLGGLFIDGMDCSCIADLVTKNSFYYAI